MKIFRNFFFFLLIPSFFWGKRVSSKLVFFKEDSQSYQGLFSTEGLASYPYPIKTDTINQIMGKRLAIHNAMTKMAKDILLIEPFLSKDFKPKIYQSFVEGVSMCHHENRKNNVYVRLDYFFTCDKSQYLKIKTNLKNQIEIKKRRPRASSFLGIFQKQGNRQSEQRAIVITKEYWDKLSHFYRKMNDEDD